MIRLLVYLLIDEIQWDHEGEEDYLPEVVLMIDVLNQDQESWQEQCSIALSEGFGFNHHGFKMTVCDKLPMTTAGGAYYPNKLAVIQCPF